MPRAVHAEGDAATTTTLQTPQGDDADWEQFQAFVAQVEKSDNAPAVGEDTGKEEEEGGSARDAEQSLENMAYVDRFRQALEHATAVTSHENTTQDAVVANGAKRERTEGDDSTDSQAKDGDHDEVEDVSTIVRMAAQESAKRRKLQRQDAEASDDDRSDSDSDADDSDALDLSNWRSKRI